MNSNKLTGAIAAAALIGNALLPVSALAAAANADVRLRGEAPTGAAACTFITAHLGTVEGRMGQNKTRMMEMRDKADKRIGDRRDQREQRLGDVRERHDDRRVDLYAGLEAKAETDAQKAAVVEFKADVEAAVTARKTAVDAANATFKAAMDKVRAEHKTAVDAATAKFQASVKAALEKAKADCEAGKSREEFRASLKVSLDAARKTLADDRAAIAKISAGAKVHTEAHRTAVAKAMADFKAAMEKAKIELRAAFSAS